MQIASNTVIRLLSFKDPIIVEVFVETVHIISQVVFGIPKQVYRKSVMEAKVKQLLR